MKLPKKVVWAYIVELTLSALLVWLAVVVFGLDEVVRFAGKIALTLVGFIGMGVFAASVAAILVILQKSDSPFYQWLESKGALAVYVNGFKYVAYVCVFSFVIVVALAQNPSSPIVALGTLYVLVLLGINAFTFIHNVTSLMRLEVAYRKKVNGLSKR